MSRLTEEQYRQYGKEIIPGFLYLASHYEAGDPSFLSDYHISHVLNVAEECEPAQATRDTCQVLHIPLRDSAKKDLRSFFGQAFTFLDTVRKARGRALVHCFEGRNRSATFVIAYLMRVEKLTLATAFLRTKAARSLVDPNVGFRKQLRDLELEFNLGADFQGSSLPMCADECCSLLDLELISPAELEVYTDLAKLSYEGAVLEIQRTPAKVAPKAASISARRGAAGRQAAAGAAQPFAAASRGHSRTTATAARAKPRLSPARAGGDSTRAGSVGRETTGAKAASAVSARPPPAPVPPRGPLAEALALLFQALDVKGCHYLAVAEVENAKQFLTPFRSDESTPDEPLPNADDTVVEAFYRLDKNGDGMISRTELADVVLELSTISCDVPDVDTLLCAADTNLDGRIDYKEFVAWVMSGRDEGAAFLRSSLGPVTFQHWALALLLPAETKVWDTARESSFSQQVELLASSIRPPFSTASETEGQRHELS